MNTKIDAARKMIMVWRGGVVLLGVLATLGAWAVDFYWVAEKPGLWSAKANWATESGGPGGVGVPGRSDCAIFDAGSVDATVDAAFTGTLAAVVVMPGYTGVITQARDLTVTGDFLLDGGAAVGWTFPRATTTEEVREAKLARDPAQLDPGESLEAEIMVGADTPAALTVRGTLTVTTGRTLLCPRSYTDGVGKGRTITVGNNLVVQGTLSADGQGLRVGPGTPTQPATPDDDNPISAAGPGYGGCGSFIRRGNTLWKGGGTYGSLTAPTALGSGAPRVDWTKLVGEQSPEQYWTGELSLGGGAITLVVGGATTITGRISANGVVGDVGGSGGSIYLTTGTLDGAGVITADGGAAPTYQWGRGGGGGGRIAVILTKGETVGMVALHAYGGAGRFSAPAGAGTVYLKPAGKAGTLIIDNNGHAAQELHEASATLGERILDPHVIGTLLIRNAGVLYLESGITLQAAALVTDPGNAGGQVLVDGTFFCPSAKPKENVDVTGRSLAVYTVGTAPTVTALQRQRCFTVVYYPSYNQVIVSGDLGKLPHLPTLTSAAVTVVGAAGKTLAAGTLPLDEQRKGRIILAVPDLLNGTYETRISLTDALPVPPLTFTRKHFPWEGNTLGITDTVYPPFEPLVVKGNDLHISQRVYRMNGFGLFEEMVSKGRNLLAAPITLQMETPQGAQVWTFAPGKFVKVQSNVAVYEAEAVAGPVKATTRNRIEFDGCAKVEMTMAPGPTPGEITRLWLEISLKDAEVPLFHPADFDGMRRDYSGATPRGGKIVWGGKPGAWVPPTWSVEKGTEGQDPAVIWTGADTRPWHNPTVNDFVPYLWLGAAERGLAWFANNDKGWVIDPAKTSQTITREGDRVVMRLYLINKPVTLTAPRTLVFGLQASPTRPQPADIRTTDYFGRFPWGGMSPFGAFLCSDKYPLERDFSLVDQWLAERKKPNADYSFITKKAQDVQARGAWPSPYVPRDWNRKWQEVFATRQGMSIYFEEHWTNPIHEEVDYFQHEWFGGAETYARSHTDFCVYYANEFLKRGIGLYFDNVFFNTSYNTVVNDAYRTADGRVQPATSIWEKREYYKRIWNLMCQYNAQGMTPPLRIVHHMTNELILPHSTWASATLDNEWSWWDHASGRYPAVIPPDVLLTEMTGLQTGTQGAALFPIGAFDMTPGAPVTSKPKDVPPQYARREWGMRMVHEINRGTPEEMPREEQVLRQYGYGQPGFVVYHYWDDAPLVTQGNPQVKWLAVRHATQGRGALVLQSYTREAQTATVQFPGARLLLDVITREMIPLDANGNGTVPMPVDYGTRTLLAGIGADLPVGAPQGTIFSDDFELGLNTLWTGYPYFFTRIADAQHLANHVLQIERSTLGGGPYPTLGVKTAGLPQVHAYQVSMKLRLPVLPDTPNLSIGTLVIAYGDGAIGGDGDEALQPLDPDDIDNPFAGNTAKKMRFAVNVDVNTVDGTPHWAFNQGQGLNNMEAGKFRQYNTHLLVGNYTGQQAVIGDQLGVPDTQWHTLTLRVQGDRHVWALDGVTFLDAKTDAVTTPCLLFGTPHRAHAPTIEVDEVTIVDLAAK